MRSGGDGGDKQKCTIEKGEVDKRGGGRGNMQKIKRGGGTNEEKMRNKRKAKKKKNGWKREERNETMVEVVAVGPCWREQREKNKKSYK